jgi:hypothetical protein
MMEFTLQDFIVMGVVLIAAIYAGYKTVKQFSARDDQAACTKCGCSTKNSADKKNAKIPVHFLKNRS